MATNGLPNRGRVAAVAVALAALSLAASTADGTAAARKTACSRTLRVPILMYHRINVVTAHTPSISRRLTVAPAVFARQLAWLDRHGYRTITQAQLLAALSCRRALPPKPIVLTFDDGYADVFFHASTLIARRRMHAIAYVITGRISAGDPSFLTWPLLRALERRGIEIGSHTVSHRDLTTLSDRELRTELLESRRVLERRLGHPVPWLAYPFGAHDARVVAFARGAGYRLAVTTNGGDTQDARRPLELERLRVLDSTGVKGLAAMLAAA
jgi:peptidoglycan/xylan/chitin deacetylase (PgdA/CDA1 family)